MADDTRGAGVAPLDIRKTVAEMQAIYRDSPSSNYLHIIDFGDIGTGKTHLLETCPRPCHIDSFDKGGTVTIRRAIEAGWIVADTAFEDENPRDPKVLELFDKKHVERKKSGYYNYFGTYMLDGMTMLFASAMNVILKKRGRSGWIPEVGKGKDNDYVAAQALIEPILKDILNLPCHVIINAHLDMSTDEANPNKSFIGPKISGQLQSKLMSVTDEIWCMQNINTSKGWEHRILTQPNGLYRCRSRLAANGAIEMYEEPDFRAILKKGGFEAADKVIPWLEK